MRKSPFLVVAALLAAAPASALMLRAPAPQTVGAAYRSPFVVQTLARGFRGLQPAAFSLSAPQTTASPLGLGQSLIQSAPEVRVQAYREAPLAALSRSVGGWNSLLNTGAPGESLSSGAQALFDGRRLDAGSEGSFAAGQGSRYEKEIKEGVEAAVELTRLAAGTQATDAVLAATRQDAAAKLENTAKLVEAVEDGLEVDPMIVSLTIEAMDMLTPETLQQLYGMALEQSIARGSVPEASRAEILEKIKTPIATIVRIHQAWRRTLAGSGSKIDAEAKRLLAAAVYLAPFVGSEADDENILKVAELVKALEKGEPVSAADIDLALQDFASVDEAGLQETLAAELERAVKAGTVPEADRSKVSEKIKASVATIARVQDSWIRTLAAAKDKSPKFGANLLSKLEDMRGGATFSVAVTYDKSESGKTVLRFIEKKHGLKLELMEGFGVAVLRGVGIDALRVLAAQPVVTHVDLEQNYSIH